MNSARLVRCRPHSTSPHVSRTLQRRAFATSPAAYKPFTVLALESSADDTCAAVVDSDRVVHSNVVIKQNDVHEKYKGIHVLPAIYAHVERMPLVIQRALIDARMRMQDIDGIAFTQGPGMAGCLAVGCNSAKALAAALGKPLVGVNHMRAHALTVTLTEERPPPFPHLTLLISGGHTMIVLVKSEVSYELLANTTDDSIGQAFDRLAVLIGLEWGQRGLGAALEACAREHSPAEDGDYWIKFPVIMQGRPDFSFSGVRSAGMRIIDDLKEQDGGEMSARSRAAFAYKFQEAVADQLEDKLIRAIKNCRLKGVKPTALVASGGVASNQYLRSRLHQAVVAAHEGSGAPLRVYYPPPALCTDNAVMIAWASMSRFLAGDTDPLDIMPLKGWKINMERPVWTGHE
ncbi:peptidase M22, glycoprotease [Calocera cornea HHB12733]|uniref:N(6)-L-threonylcarbamoyladenine synthase n=1 Tax=Calocera cornea HHB12733 TaxID=1353952 RepID=A0A165DFZ8_9BASI|nr:peptidase M22, glycoprotease [Calocera cornea HHB12733]